jgi:hypothetical protein
VPPPQVDIKEVIKASANHLAAMYQLAEKIGTLATAALAFTVTFAKSITPPGTTVLPPLIKVAWLCFVAAVIGFFLVYLGSINMLKRIRPALLDESTPRVNFIKPPCYFHVGIWLTCWGFLIGLMLLAIYGIKHF